MSAACLLERYMEDLGHGAMAAQPCTYPPPQHLEVFDYNVVRNHIRQQCEQNIGPMSDHEREIRRRQNNMWRLKNGVFPISARKSEAYQEEEHDIGGESLVFSDDVVEAEQKVLEEESDDDVDVELREMIALRDSRRKRGTLKRRK